MASYRELLRRQRPIGRLEREFLVFHEANPWVYERLVQLSRKLKRAGFTKYSTRTLISVLRFEWDLKTSGQSVVVAGGEEIRVKLNDHHSPFYARKLMREHPEFAGFFETRRAEADNGE